MVEIFSDDYLSSGLAFRGGTALHKLYLNPQVRYSEDIDLVQIKAEPIKETIDKLRDQFQFLGSPIVKQKANNNTLIFRFTSENNIPMRLKIEINCREHHSVFGIVNQQLNVQSEWFNGAAKVKTYTLEELLGTKLRALYQRKKGRDLFDIWYAITQKQPDLDKIIYAWKMYMKQEGKRISRKEFLLNMDKKMVDKAFATDMDNLLRPKLTYPIEEAFDLVKEKIIEKI